RAAQVRMRIRGDPPRGAVGRGVRELTGLDVSLSREPFLKNEPTDGAEDRARCETNPIEAGHDVHQCARMCTNTHECASPPARAADETNPTSAPRGGSCFFAPEQMRVPLTDRRR